jgi:RNA polymerase sigma-70 factor (ECF subfamily)
VTVRAHSTCCELPEAVAIRMAQRGDSFAFEQLYRAHVRRVFALCLRMLSNTAEAEDLTQEVFLTAFRKLKSFRGDSAFSTWLHRVGVNAVLMHLRKKRLSSTSLEELDQKREQAGLPAFEPGETDARLEGHADRVRLEKAIAKLPEGYKLSLILHDVQGYLHTEMAEILGCTTGTTKSQLHKARQRVREILQKDELIALRPTGGAAVQGGSRALVGSAAGRAGFGSDHLACA